MARKTPSRMDMRRMAEAAERIEADEAAAEKASPTKKAAKKAAPKKRAARKKTVKAAPRKLMMWAVYNGSLKEEGRYTFAEKEKAEEKLETLRAKSTKKLYFLQPLKVPLTEAVAEGLVPSRDELAEPDKKGGEEE